MVTDELHKRDETKAGDVTVVASVFLHLMAPVLPIGRADDVGPDPGVDEPGGGPLPATGDAASAG